MNKDVHSVEETTIMTIYGTYGYMGRHGKVIFKMEFEG